MTHDILRCDLWLNVLHDRVHGMMDVFRWGIEDEMIEKTILAIFFVMRSCS